MSIRLHTGRTHQIRCQLSTVGLPIVGDKKYGSEQEMDEGIALWSRRLRFVHPKTGETMEFSKNPPAVWPWTKFSTLHGA